LILHNSNQPYYEFSEKKTNYLHIQEIHHAGLENIEKSINSLFLYNLICKKLNYYSLVNNGFGTFIVLSGVST